MLGEVNEGRGRGGEQAAAPDLSQLFEVTALNFPYPILLTRTDVGDILQLQLHAQDGKNGVMVLYQGQVAGYISLQGHAGLMASMRNGNAYQAVISENYGGHCRVLIRPAG